MERRRLTSNHRQLTVYEQEAWNDYERVLDGIPRGRMYDRVSVMKAHPELQKAFTRACNSKLFYRLTKDYE